MSLQVLVAHTGQRLRADPTTFGSLDAFKSWLSDAAGVDAGSQILLTGQGKQAKLQALLVEKEIFLYDRQIVAVPSGSNKPKPVSSPLTAGAQIEPFPDSLSNPTDIQAWRALFKARSEWAKVLAADARSVADEARRHFDAFEVIERALGVALGNLQSHVRALRHRFGEARSWSKQAEQDHLDLVNSLNDALTHLPRLPARPEFVRFLPLNKQNTNDQGTTLDAFITQAEIDEAIGVVKDVGPSIAAQISSLERDVVAVESDSTHLTDKIEKLFSQSVAVLSRDTKQLMQEIEVFAKKINSDYIHVTTLPSDPQSVSKASKTALLHTKNHLPSLIDFREELRQYLEQVVEQRNVSASRTTETMQRIAAIEADFAKVNARVVSLDVPAESVEAVELASLISNLPYVYGAVLIEGVRRREWTDRIRGESSYLAEDIASYREEEQRRRKKWLKTLGTYVKKDSVDGNALNFELNLQPEEDEWPEISRDDISDYLRATREIKSLANVVEELSEAAKELDRPSRRQLKQAKGFKMGSIHEAGALKGSFLLRGGDELSALREANQKLDDDLKGQKSRVRKLEDLLYKQGMASRNSSAANIFQASDAPSPESGTPDPAAASPRSRTSNETLSRKAPANSRRQSLNKTSEDKTMARRIVSLEAELKEERQKRQQLEKASSEKEQTDGDLKSQVEEALSTKNDLMENMEAQQREFDEDRRLLKEEISKLKVKNEEMEDELDRILGSRDNERAGADTKLQAVEHELEQMRDEVTTLQEDVKARDELQDDYLRSLHTVHNNLDPQGVVPSTFAELVEDLDGLSQRSVRRLQDMESAVASATADKEALQATLDKHEQDSTALHSQIESLNEQTALLRDESTAEKARCVSLQAELADGRDQLRQLRTKFADGETGSEALRQRLEQQAARASALSGELAQSKSHIINLDFELSKLQRTHQELTKTHGTLSTRLERRSARDRELTKRLISRNQDSIRLLDSLGLSALRKDDAMFIQRTSKLANASQTLNEPSGASSDMSASLLAAQPFDHSFEPNLSKWMYADDEEQESSQYGRFVARLDEFDATTFSEAVIKLRRDVEWTGKKWKMEARHYRDKQHRAQSEAQGKIAYRSFKEGDLALFLPTRNQATRPFAAFNVGAPHYFLREQDSHRLKHREWLVARISKVEERVVNLSKTLDSLKASDGRSITESEGGAAADDDNPFELSDGLRWYLLDAAEEKAGAPSTPGLGKSTVASTTVDAKGSIRMKKMPAGKDASTTLNKSLESRRSSSNSKRGSISGAPPPDVGASASAEGQRQASLTAQSPAEGRSTSAASASGKGKAQPPPSGLGLEIGSSQSATRTREEQQQPLAGSPATASLMGFLGNATASRPFSRGTGRDASSLGNTRPSSVRSQSPERLQPDVASSTLRSVNRSPAKSPSKPSQSGMESPSAGKRPAAKQSAWNSLWSLDHTVILEDSKSKSRK